VIARGDHLKRLISLLIWSSSRSFVSFGHSDLRDDNKLPSVSLYSISACNGIAFIVMPIAPSILIRSARLFSLACALHTARAGDGGVGAGWGGEEGLRGRVSLGAG